MSSSISNNKSVAILLTLDRKEVGRFRKLLHSPFFNTNEILIDTFESLIKRREQIEAKKLSREILHQLLFPAKTYNNKDVTDALSRLGELLDTFLIQCEVEANVLLKKRLLLKNLAQRNLPNQFNKVYQKKEKKSFSQRDGDYFLEHFYIQNEQFNHPDFKGEGQDGEKIINKTTHFLDNGYLFYRLKMACERVSRRNIYYTKPLPQVTTNLLSYINNSAIALHPTVYIYQQILELFTQPLDQGKFGDVVKEYQLQIKQYSHPEALGVLQFLINFSYWQYSLKESQFLPILFELHDYGLQQNLLLQNQKISNIAFTNIVNIGLANSKFEWTQNFITS